MRISTQKEYQFNRGVVHAAIALHKYQVPTRLIAWCLLSPIYSLDSRHIKVFYDMTDDPKLVDCQHCLERIKDWTQNQQGAPLPMTFIKELGFEIGEHMHRRITRQSFDIELLKPRKRAPTRETIAV